MNATEDDPCQPSSSSQAHLALAKTLTLWLEGHITVVVGLIGLATNFVAIPVLCSPKLGSTFNRLLVCLAVFDNVFVACCVLEACRKFYEQPLSAAHAAHELVFIHCLYQLQNVALTCSIYTTLAVAVERHLAVSRPVEYHIMVAAAAAPGGGGAWRRVWLYAAPTVAFSVLFNLPKFFELGSEWQEFNATSLGGAGAGNETVWVVNMKPTDLRLDENYVYFYVNLARFVVMCVVPLVGLVVLNSGIHRYREGFQFRTFNVFKK